MRGQDIVFVTPGAIYGPGVFAERALDPTSFTRAALRGMKGELDSYVTIPMMWTYAADVAEIALRALDRGAAGGRYLALGRPEDVCSLAAFCNQARSSPASRTECAKSTRTPRTRPTSARCGSSWNGAGPGRYSTLQRRPRPWTTGRRRCGTAWL